ncbi:2',5'-phosphodiesterase 12-like, partial [Varroa destructor]|uniref:2',5'-phosphodiesterase 12 n=1 Tax=Varroa destructor TaxID=109461 RepID=A0A7M7KVS0_VARDE
MVLLNFTRTLSTRELVQRFTTWNKHRTIMMCAKRQARMAFVKLDNEKNRLSLSFKYESDFVADRLFTINRGQEEPIETSLTRLQMNITGIAMKKFRKQKQKPRAQENISNSNDANKGCSSNENTNNGEDKLKPSITIEDLNGTIIEPFINNREAFRTGHVLNIDGKRFPIVVDAPTVVRISLPKIMMTGFPIQAYVTLEHANLPDCVFSWWRNSVKGETFADYAKDDIIKDKSQTWLRIRGESSRTYNARPEDVGHKIMVYCEPRCGPVVGVEVSAVSSSVVNTPPERCAFEDRHQLTPDILPDNMFRVVSYNLLADVYARTEFSKTVLFNYCPRDALDFEFRKHLLIKEILGYNGDVLCLQEVDRGMFKHELQPCLSLQGFDGIYCEKGAEGAEGCAVFYRKSKFSLTESNRDVLSEKIEEKECLADIRCVVEKNLKLKDRLRNRSTVLQRVLLRHVESKREILVCNTHLYFHPDADHIRLLQAYISVRLAEEQLRKVDEKVYCIP